MKNYIETLKKYKTEREVDEYNESYSFREGYVKAINDSINLINKRQKNTYNRVARACRIIALISLFIALVGIILTIWNNSAFSLKLLISGGTFFLIFAYFSYNIDKAYLHYTNQTPTI